MQEDALSSDVHVAGERSKTWFGWFVLVVACSILLTLLLIAVRQARMATRRMASSNNLKQLGLGMLNYQAAYKKFPIGADFDSRGAKHGWFTRICPYLEASSLYNRIDQRFGWEHPLNNYLFKVDYSCGQNPQIAWTSTTEGFGLTHYMANPNVVHRSSAVREADLLHGASQTWLVSEIGQRFQPWGYPFNWRSMESIVTDQRADKPLWCGVFQFVYADGSVRELDSNSDMTVVRELDQAPPIAVPESIAIPPREFEYRTSRKGFVRYPLKDPTIPQSKGLWATVIVSFDGEVAHTMEFSLEAGETVDTLRTIVRENPEFKVVILRTELTDEIASVIGGLKQLECLSVIGSRLTETGVRSLQRAQSLLEVAGTSFTDTERLQAAFPDCEFSSFSATQ